MKLDFDIKTKGATLDFDMKDTKVIRQNAKKEIVTVDIKDMLANQKTGLFVELTKRYANGEIAIIGNIDNTTGFVSAVTYNSDTDCAWSVVSATWYINKDGMPFDYANVVIVGLLFRDGVLSGNIGEYPISEYLRKTDESLPTNDKTIVGAIKELYEREDKQGLSREQVEGIVDEKIGSIETALDSIIALQNSLIGGGTV